jgi:hypothetical protein
MSVPRWLNPAAPNLLGWRLLDEDEIGGTLRLQEWMVKTTRTDSDRDRGLLDLTRPSWATVAPLIPDEQLHDTQGADWNLITPHRAVDGDTIRAWRTQVSWQLESEQRTPANSLTAKWIVRVVFDDPEELDDGEDLRLVNLDTPEKKEREPYRLATAEAWAWVTSHADRLRCITYPGGGFDRLLVDLYVLGPDGTIEETLTDWMLKFGNNGRGWNPYVPSHLRKVSRYGS